MLVFPAGVQGFSASQSHKNGTGTYQKPYLMGVGSALPEEKAAEE
jgi:hypothetical protein